MATACVRIRRVFVGWLACAVVLVGLDTVALADTAREATRLRAALVADLRRNPGIPGEALAVNAPGIHVALAVGLAYVNARTRLDGDTPFRVASVTKTFVAAAILRLSEEGKIGLGTPISRYLSAASLAVLNAGRYQPHRITVRQLLLHTGGLFDYAESAAYDHINESDPGHEWTRAEQLRFATEHGNPAGKPGKTFNYSDTGYILLGEILERVSGEPLAAAVRHLLHFDRVGLDDTFWEKLEPAPAGASPGAHQYYATYDNIALDASSDLYGGGGLISTVSDLATFYRALFHGEVFDRRETLDTMTKVSGPGRDDAAAMGIFALDVDGERCFSHPGYWGTEAAYCPRLDLAFARTTNQADDDDFDSAPLERVIVSVAKSAARP
jgi:D-alanyl-D-alanine carboxypeptidase